MKFYDLEWLADKCGTDNKYEITVKVSAEARKKSENDQERLNKDNPYNERFISDVLLEIEEGTSPINAKKPDEEQQEQTQTQQNEQSGELEQTEQKEKTEVKQAENTEKETEKIEQPESTEQKLEVEA
ncbi:MAG: hypothetical protein IJP69_00815 [Synergistaceae bacterium]|nr:hypothetical protein [Synergistaceae bacterium]MBR0078897.1 hypothetical protein [Synergistaceae bacterium]